MLVYRLAVGTLRAAAPLVSRGESKLARGMAGRRHAHELLETWGRTLRDPDRPVYWFHAPSVGEGFQAQAVIDAVLARRPDAQIVYTFFSPSAEDLARRIGADVATYLPWDLVGPCSAALDAVRPDALVFTKTEVWPVLTACAVDRAIPVAIVGATVPEGAGRMRWPARALLRGTWARLSVGCANGPVDAERLAALGVPPAVIHATGDPGIDSAARRFDDAAPDAPYLAPFRADVRPTVVAGSTWPADEAVLLPALSDVRTSVGDLRVVIAPHEPAPSHVDQLTRALGSDGWRVATLADVERSGSTRGVDAVVVERVGVLAHLYGVADVSYVGGGFHEDGLHSVLEPAAAGSPIVFGPRHANARAAADLVGQGGAKIASDSRALARVIGRWLEDADERNRIGRSARSYIESHLGASERTAETLLTTIERAHAH